MAITSTSSELIRLNDRSVMLPSDTFLRCAVLGILRRLRYIHRGAHSTRRTRSTMTAIPGNIPVILSNERPSRRRCLSPCGVNLNHLRSLSDASQHDFSSQEPNQLEIKMALLNARSVLNKTFLLNDFFLSNNLDFLFITETWLTADDLSPLSELSPVHCNYFSCPRTSSRGGGVAVIFKDLFKCKLLPVNVNSSFEVLMCKVEFSSPLLCVLIYRPPKANNDFLKEFSDFLSDLVSSADNLLIVGDFNIHLCCPSRPLSRDFVQLLDSFNLTQYVSGPTHKLGHTLDYVFSVSNVTVSEAGLSDHWPVLFDSVITSSSPVNQSSTYLSRSINLFTALQFTEAYIALTAHSSVLAAQSISVDELTNSFNSTCLEILNVVAPLKSKKTKPKNQPWFNHNIKVLRKDCRRAERRWKKDKLQISYQLLQSSLSKFLSLWNGQSIFLI